MENKFSPETSLKISKDNPAAAGNFLKYMHAVEPQILEAQKKFASEINAAMQSAAMAFIEGEKLDLPEEAVKAMTQNCAAICKKMCQSGDEMVKRQFAEMSESMIKAVGK